MTGSLPSQERARSGTWDMLAPGSCCRCFPCSTRQLVHFFAGTSDNASMNAEYKYYSPVFDQTILNQFNSVLITLAHSIMWLPRILQQKSRWRGKIDGT